MPGQKRIISASAASLITSGSRFLATIGGLFLFFLMLLTAADVVFRYFLNRPLSGVAELTELLLAVIVFACLPATTANQEHVSTDAIEPWLTARGKKVQMCIVHIICSVALGIMSYRIWIVAGNIWAYSDSSAFLRIPLAPFAYFFSLAAGSAAAISAGLFVSILTNKISVRQIEDNAENAQKLVG